MGFLDKVKEQGNALASKATEGVKQGQAKLDESAARKRAEGLLAELGAWTWAQRNGRDDGNAAAEIERVMTALASHESEHGAIAAPSVAPPPPPPAVTPADAPPEPPAAAGGNPAPPAPPASPPPPPAPATATDVPPAPPVAPASPSAAPPSTPPGGYSLDDL